MKQLKWMTLFSGILFLIEFTIQAQTSSNRYPASSPTSSEDPFGQLLASLKDLFPDPREKLLKEGRYLMCLQNINFFPSDPDTTGNRFLNGKPINWQNDQEADAYVEAYEKQLHPTCVVLALPWTCLAGDLYILDDDPKFRRDPNDKGINLVLRFSDAWKSADMIPVSASMQIQCTFPKLKPKQITLNDVMAVLGNDYFKIELRDMPLSRY